MLRGVLDEASGKWGIRVTRVEIKAIDPPKSVKDAMEKQMRAEREKRAAILTAEGLRQAQILTADGDKQGTVLRPGAPFVSDPQGLNRLRKNTFNAIVLIGHGFIRAVSGCKNECGFSH